FPGPWLPDAPDACHLYYGDEPTHRAPDPLRCDSWWAAAPAQPLPIRPATEVHQRPEQTTQRAAPGRSRWPDRVLAAAAASVWRPNAAGRLLLQHHACLIFSACLRPYS